MLVVIAGVTAEVHREGEWWVALFHKGPSCLSGAVGQGRTRALAERSFASAIADLTRLEAGGKQT
jgi:hypothetical protein